MQMVLAVSLLAGAAHAQVKTLDPQKDPKIGKEVKAFLKVLNVPGAKGLETFTPADARKVLEGAQQSVQVDVSGIEVTEKNVQEDGLNLKLYVVRPEGVSGTLPVFMFFHGGGWILGDFATHKRLVRDLVVNSGAVAVFVEYSRSPEAQYPTALNECYAGTKWVSEHGAEINVDPSRMAIAGNSVGGNLTAAVALMAKDKHGPALKLQVMLWPVTDANFNTGSYLEFANDRFLTRNMMIWFWDAYAPKSNRTAYYVTPLKASLDELKGLPPALIQVAENDVLRDEGEAYGRKLDQAGVPTTLVRFDGLIHDYGLLNPIATVPAVQSAMRYAGNELRNALK